MGFGVRLGGVHTFWLNHISYIKGSLQLHLKMQAGLLNEEML